MELFSIHLRGFFSILPLRGSLFSVEIKIDVNKLSCHSESVDMETN